MTTSFSGKPRNNKQMEEEKRVEEQRET